MLCCISCLVVSERAVRQSGGDRGSEVEQWAAERTVGIGADRIGRHSTRPDDASTSSADRSNGDGGERQQSAQGDEQSGARQKSKEKEQQRRVG